MKKISLFILSFLICALFFLSPLPTHYLASADSLFLRVINDETPFFTNKTDEKPLFFLPYTYYVKVLNADGEFMHVEVYGIDRAALDGYVPTSMLFDDGLSVDNPYLSLEITTAKTAVLYQDFTLSLPVQYVFPEREMKYYGSVKTSHGNVYFVSYNNRLGYVKEEDVYPFLITNHPNELTFIVPETPLEPPEPEPEITEDFFGLKVVIIVCIVFAGIIALFFIVKKSPRHSISSGYYDENDYE